MGYLLEFSEKVYKLSLSEMKRESDFDLRTSGARSDGDRLVFKFKIFKFVVNLPF